MKNDTNNNSAEVLRDKKAREEKMRAYLQEKKGLLKLFLILFGAIALLSLITLLLTLLTDVVYVHNTAMTEDGGREVSVGGIAFLQALFTGNFTSASYDDIAVPFYMYAKDYCSPAAIMTLFSVILLGLTLILSLLGILFAVKKQNYSFSLLSTVFAALSFILNIVLLSIALSMKNGNILSTYCGGNPACSIRSDMVWCLILSLLMLGCGVYATVRFLQLKKKRRQIS